MGGMGLTSAVTLAPAAYIAGAEVAMRLSPAFASVWSGHEPLSPTCRQHAAIDDCILRILETENAIRARCDAEEFTPALVPPPVLPDIAADFVQHFSALSPTALQQSITHRISTLNHIATVAEAVEAGDVERVARLRALREEGASEWLTALPTEPRLRLSNAYWRWAARLRLGMPIPIAADTCSGCTRRMPEVGDSWHSLSCVSGSGGHMTARHDAVVNVLSRFSNLMGVVNLTEPADLCDTDGRRPDIEFHLPGEAPLLIDVTIHHPTAPSYRRVAAKHGADKVADGRSARKSDKYDGIADSNGMRFIPFVVSTYGGWHKSAKSVLRRLIAAMEPAYCLLSRADWQRQLTQQVAIAIQRGNAAIMIHAAHRDQHNALHGSPRRRHARTRSYRRAPSAVSTDPPLSLSLRRSARALVPASCRAHHDVACCIGSDTGTTRSGQCSRRQREDACCSVGSAAQRCDADLLDRPQAARHACALRLLAPGCCGEGRRRRRAAVARG